MRKRLSLLSLAIAAMGAPAAHAGVLNADNWDLLCTAEHLGRPAVDADRLALMIVGAAGANLFLDGANPAGNRDGAVQVSSTDTQPSEPAYFLLHAAATPEPGDRRPFLSAAARSVRSAALAQFDDLNLLMATRAREGGTNRTYRLEPRQGFGLPRNPGDQADPRRLFGPGRLYVILCETRAVIAGAPTPPPARPAAGTRDRDSGPPAFNTRFVVRGTVAALHVDGRSADALSGAKPATISYERNDVANTETFKLNAIVGLQLFRPSGSLRLIPYLSYERTDVTGAGDVEKLSPGLLVAHYLERPTFALHSRLEASFIDDLRQGSHQGKLRFYLDPAFALSGGGVLFGQYLQVGGPFYLRPELTIIGDASRVFRAGTSTALANAEDYFGLGGDLSVRARLDVGPLSAFTFYGGVRNLFMFGEISQETIRRWYGGIEFTPQNWPYIGLGFTFTNGENDDTFQREEKYGLNLTFRY